MLNYTNPAILIAFRKLARRKRFKMKPRDIIELRTKHRLSRAELARMIGVHPAQITRWEKGTQKIPHRLAKFLDCLQRNGWEQT